MSAIVRNPSALPGVSYATLDLESLELDPDQLRDAEQEIWEHINGTKERRREWYAGRIAARAALSDIGHPNVAVLRSDTGAPRLVGVDAAQLHVAITHGKRLAAAVASHREAKWPHVGIDIVDDEDHDRILHIAKRVLTDDEKARADNPLHVRLAWGAREAVAKATNTGMFVFALSKCWTVAVDEATRSVTTNLEGISVIYEPLDDGGVLVLAGATGSALSRAQEAAAGAA